ncbi:hypothetical protein M758_4G253200, partial [Ceratodon purpureus]
CGTVQGSNCDGRTIKFPPGIAHFPVPSNSLGRPVSPTFPPFALPRSLLVLPGFVLTLSSNSVWAVGCIGLLQVAAHPPLPAFTSSLDYLVPYPLNPALALALAPEPQSLLCTAAVRAFLVPTALSSVLCGSSW